MKEYPSRKHPRLKTYDYSSQGIYFITFCTYQREWILSNIVGRGDLTPPLVELTDIGQIVDDMIQAISKHYPNVVVDNYIIMPNHIHMLIRVAEKKDGITVMRIMKALKGLSARKIGSPIWQTSFHDHVITNEEEYQTRFRYIEENPAKWQQDKYYYQEV